MKRTKAVLFLTAALFLACLAAQGQTSVRGIVSDAKTGEPVPFVNISVPGKTTGVTTDFDGQYVLMSLDTLVQLQYSSLGYKTEYRKVVNGEKQVINVKLARDVKTLQEVTVKDSKKRYKNKDNPAVDLIR